MERGQFTFYRSYYEALKKLPKKDREAVCMAMFAYALDEVEPKLDGVPGAVFMLIKPTLDAGRNKAASRSGKTKSSEEQTDNKTTTNEEQTFKEKEGEREKEREKENECYISLTPFEQFWQAYPRQVGREAAAKAFAKVPKTAYPLILPAIEKQKKSRQWQEDGGKYVPNPAKWLSEARWMDSVEPAESSGGVSAEDVRRMQKLRENVRGG